MLRGCATLSWSWNRLLALKTKQTRFTKITMVNMYIRDITLGTLRHTVFAHGTVKKNARHSFVWKERTIERFHPRVQHLCKFIRTKESVYIRKEFNSHRIGLEHQYGRRDVMWKRSFSQMPQWHHRSTGWHSRRFSVVRGNVPVFTRTGGAGNLPLNGNGLSQGFRCCSFAER